MTGSPDSPQRSDPPRGEQAERLYSVGRMLPPDAWADFVEEACAGDDALRSEMLSLLQNAEAAEAFFARLAEVVLPHEWSPPTDTRRYQVLECIGVGGMGAVYRARDTGLERDVALKFLPSYLHHPSHDAERLFVEARAAAALEHPNVCTIHEIGIADDGRPFIAMALYSGETLKERLARGPLGLTVAVEIAVQVARGLGAAHAHGIVHRDVKPGNIMITRDGTVKLLDFGLAKGTDQSLTAPETTPGTIAYMSPEQAKGEPVGPPSDLWSLGVVLREMVTGIRPFRGGNDRAILQAIVHDRAESLRATRTDAPPSLERIVERCLAKRPEDRYASTDELVCQLSRVFNSSDSATSVSSPRLAGRRLAAYAEVAAILAVLASGSLWLAARSAASARQTEASLPTAPYRTAPDERARRIAVLPFTNLSRDPEEEFFSDGLTEEVIGTLAQVRALRVAARSSVFLFKRENRDIREIGTALNAGTILEGSVRRDGNRVRVSVQLISADDGFHLWSESYDRLVTDIFDIQRDLAVRIASALEAELSTAERGRLSRAPTSSAEAFTLYLRGRHFWNRRTSAGLWRAIEYFERAIDADPQYASAYAGLATTYSLLGLSSELAPAEAERLMREAAFRAVELDDELAEAHAALGSYFHTFGWDSEAAEHADLRAIELDPSYVTARHFYGNLLRAMGRFDESLAQKTAALELDPLVPVLGESLAFTSLSAGRPAEALHHVQNVLELDSMYARAHTVLGLIYETTDRLDEALRAHQRARELGQTQLVANADIARALARMGREQEARDLLEQLERESAAAENFDPSLASVRVALKDVDGALGWLEQAYRRKHPYLRFMSGDPRFSALSGEPRYVDLLRRVGLPS